MIKTHRFWVQLMSGLGQDFVHTSLVKKCDKSETPSGKRDQNYNTTHLCKTDNTVNNKILCMFVVASQSGWLFPYLERFVTGSLITILSFTSPNLQK